MKRRQDGSRRSLYPGAAWGRHDGVDPAHDLLNPRAKIPAFLKRGAGHALHIADRQGLPARGGGRLSRTGSRGRQGSRRSSKEDRGFMRSRARQGARLPAGTEAESGKGMLRDSRMASGAYADGMQDGWVAYAVAEGPQRARAMAARRKCGSYLFGSGGSGGAGGARAASPGAAHVQAAGGVEVPATLTVRPASRQRSVQLMASHQTPRDRRREAGGGSEVSLWQDAVAATGSEEQATLQAAMSRAALRDEQAFERLADATVADLERDLRWSMRRTVHQGDVCADETAGGGKGWENVRHMHGSAVRVPTNAEDSTLSDVVHPRAREAAQGHAAGTAELAELAEVAAAQRRRRRARMVQQLEARQRRQWREGGVDTAKDVLWAQAVVDLRAGSDGGWAAREDAGRRPCTGAPVHAGLLVRGCSSPAYMSWWSRVQQRACSANPAVNRLSTVADLCW